MPSPLKPHALLLALTALLSSYGGVACQSAPTPASSAETAEVPSPQERRQALIDVSTPAGAQAAWFLSLFDPVNASYELTTREIEQHFSQSFLQRQSSEEIRDLLHARRAELGGLLVEEVLRDRRHDIMLRTSRTEPGQEHPARWIVALSVVEEPPFRIQGLILERDEFDERLHAINRAEVEPRAPRSNDYGITPSRAPASFPPVSPSDQDDDDDAP